VPATTDRAPATTAAATTLLTAIDDDAPGRVIRSQRDGHLVPEDDADPVLTQLAAEVREHLMPRLELDPEVSRRQDFDDASLEFYMLLTTHRRREPYLLRRAWSMIPSAATVRYIEDPRALVVGHAVKLLRNGTEAFPTWLAAIELAEKRISLEMYIFSDDAIGRRFAAALGRAVARGVEVRVLYDYVGCRETPAAFFDDMRGLRVGSFAPGRVWRWVRTRAAATTSA